MTYTVILEGSDKQHPIDGMARHGRYFRWKADEDICDKKLPELLAQGWKLRGMEIEEHEGSKT